MAGTGHGWHRWRRPAGIAAVANCGTIRPAGDYDITAKHPIAGGPRDWLTLAGLPVPADPAAVTAVDAELSTLSTAPDKLIRVGDPAEPYIAHVEFQSWPDPDFDSRVLVCNVLARKRHRLPVRSVAYLLGPAAVTPNLTGGFREPLSERVRLEFDYQLVRVWELPVEAVLTGGLGTLPLAPVTAVDQASVPAVLERMRERLHQEATPVVSREVWLATRVLLGLQYDQAFIRVLLKGVLDMRGSTTYQEIIEIGERRGERRGRVKGARELLLGQATGRFGPPSDAALTRLRSVTEPAELAGLANRLFTASDWEDCWLKT